MKKPTKPEQKLPASANKILDLLNECSATNPEILNCIFSSQEDHWECQLRESAVVPENYRQKKFRKLIQFINENYRNKIEENQAAGLVGLSPSEFCRFFKRQAGITFVAYINKVRIEEAARLLIETDLTCENIGYDCGFSTLSYFYKVFKKHYGLSPTKYRRQ